MYKQVLAVTPAGTTGAATGSAQVVLENLGELHSVYLDYTSVTSDTVVRLQFTDPAATLMTVAANATDGWYFPRSVAVNVSGAGYSAAMDLERFPLVGTLVARATSSTPTTNGVKAHVYIDED
jgi:hypothetical protein